MPEYLAPGVYIEEIRTGPVPIEGVGTSTAGFVGQTLRGPLAPRLVTSWLDFHRWYGAHIDTAISYLPWAVQGFFDNGGQRAFIARVARDGAGTASFELGTDGDQSLLVQAVGPGEWGNRVFLRVRRGTQRGVRLTVLYFTEMPDPFVDPLDPDQISNPDRVEPAVIEDYDNLGVAPRGPNYALTTVNGASHLVTLSWTAPPPAGTPALPADVEFADTTLDGGSDGADAATLADYVGDPATPTSPATGLTGLEAIDEIALLCVPDEVTIPEITEQVLVQCERLKDRFAVLQAGQGLSNVTQITVERPSLYGAIYWPWIRVFDPITQGTRLVPPGGHVVGIYARTDITRGVHKAPANEDVRGMITRDISGTEGPLEFKVTKGQQDILNPRGVNVIRDFRADRRGIRVWGARTISTEPDWKYVNVRRLFIFLEESIDEGTQFVVFEPNHEPTWAMVRRSIVDFLTRVWRGGALMGTTPDEAFFVRCDRTTMTEADINAGQLICYIGVAPVKPAEFVIFRFTQKTLEASPT
jgi:phage tail sheath protein FI